MRYNFALSRLKMGHDNNLFRIPRWELLAYTTGKSSGSCDAVGPVHRPLDSSGSGKAWSVIRNPALTSLEVRGLARRPDAAAGRASLDVVGPK